MLKAPQDIIIKMKSQKTKNKAFKLYLTNVSLYSISKKLNISEDTLHRWKKQNNWKLLKKQSLEKQDKNLSDMVVKEQMEITRLAQERLIERLNDDDLKGTELVSLTKHRLELVRPKQTTNNLNITKNENTAIQIVIPKEVEELLQKEVIK